LTIVKLIVEFETCKLHCSSHLLMVLALWSSSLKVQLHLQNIGGSCEKSNDETLAKTMASLCDIFVMGAFGTAHRAQASTEGVIQFAPSACAGPLLTRELFGNSGVRVIRPLHYPIYSQPNISYG
jgi:hypothetical protein